MFYELNYQEYAKNISILEYGTGYVCLSVCLFVRYRKPLSRCPNSKLSTYPQP